MKKSLLAISVISLGYLTADDCCVPPAPEMFQAPVLFTKPASFSHNFFPRFIYRNHKEGGYTYDMFAVGVGYHYKKEEGFNFKCIVSTNFDLNKPFIEEDLGFHYSVPVQDNLYVQPFISSKNVTHLIKKVEDQKFIVTKGSLYAGIGFKPKFLDKLETEFKIGLSRDLYNLIFLSTDTDLFGRKFSNPFGFITEVAVGYQVVEKVNLALDGSFARGFDNEFRNYGFGINANWSF